MCNFRTSLTSNRGPLEPDSFPFFALKLIMTEKVLIVRLSYTEDSLTKLQRHSPCMMRSTHDQGSQPRTSSFTPDSYTYFWE